MGLRRAREGGKEEGGIEGWDEGKNNAQYTSTDTVTEGLRRMENVSLH